MPLIDSNPALGITESVSPNRGITDERTTTRKYPYVAPQANGMIDDGHRLNHALKMVDEDMRAIQLSSITGIPLMLLLNPRT